MENKQGARRQPPIFFGSRRHLGGTYKNNGDAGGCAPVLLWLLRGSHEPARQTRGRRPGAEIARTAACARARRLCARCLPMRGFSSACARMPLF